MLKCNQRICCLFCPSVSTEQCSLVWLADALWLKLRGCKSQKNDPFLNFYEAVPVHNWNIFFSSVFLSIRQQTVEV